MKEERKEEVRKKNYRNKIILVGKQYKEIIYLFYKNF